MIVKASTYFHNFPEISSWNHWFILSHLSFGSLVCYFTSLNNDSKHMQTSDCTDCDVHFFTHYGSQFLTIMVFSVWHWITLPVSLLNLLDSHIYKMSITNNEGVSGILLTGVCNLLVLLNRNLVCCDTVTIFQFQFMCDYNAVRNILSLFSSSYSCVTVFCA